MKTIFAMNTALKAYSHTNLMNNAEALSGIFSARDYRTLLGQISTNNYQTVNTLEK